MIESGGGDRRGHDQVAPQRGRLPEDLEFELVEPLRTLFKDEVRQVGPSSGCWSGSCGASRSRGLAWRSGSWATR